MRGLAGRAAIVTGGARGIGLTYAERLASLGANISVCDLNLKSAGQYPQEAGRPVDGSLKKTLRKYDCDVQLAEFDACDPEAAQKYAAAVHARWGRIDVTVCIAGGGSDTEGSYASVVKPESMRRTFDRNFFSTVYSCTAVAPYMKAQRAGKIINIASMAGVMALGTGRSAVYAAAKAAVAHYTRMLAQDLAAHGVTANAIAPGFIASGQWQARFANNDRQVVDEWAGKVPLARLGTPEDCANAIHFLSTFLPDYVTGQVIAVDGGMCRGPN